MRILLKYLFLFLLFAAASNAARAQSADEVYNKYVDYNLARLEDRIPDAFKLGAEIMPLADKLPPKSKIGFYNSIAKLYEDANQFDKAQPLYEKVAAAEPDYYVVHRALGYLYYHSANELGKKLNTIKADKQAHDQTLVAYKAAVNKALPHLEKAQACDPSDETLALIKSLYTNIGDKAGLASLNSRLAGLSKNCVTVLNEN